MSCNARVEKLAHHEQLQLCQTRAKYRQGRKLTAVKVYTVNDESKYLIVSGVPAIKITSELEAMCLKYGDIEVLKILPDYPHEEYTEAYLLKYLRIKNARFAKIQLDGKSYYGGVLHVCYAPELESVEETREKLTERRKTVAALTRYQQDPSMVNPSKKKKSKFLSGAAERYLMYLKPELRNVYQDLVSDIPEMDKPSKDDGIINQTSVSSSALPYQYCGPSTSSNVSNCVQEPSHEIHVDEKDESDSIVKCANTNTIPISGPHVSLQVCSATLIPQKAKRQINFPCPSISNSKKIKVFGNKNILSYKSSDK